MLNAATCAMCATSMSSGGKLLAAFLFGASVAAASAAPLEALLLSGGPSSAMFVADQSTCYSGSNSSTSVAVRTAIHGAGGGAGTAAVSVAAPQRLLLVGCLERCVSVWWCAAARWTPATNACDVASEQFCSVDVRKPWQGYLRRLVAPASDATALPQPPRPFTLNFIDVRNDAKIYTGCQDALSKGVTVSGIVCIDPDGSGCFPVWCNFAAGEGYVTIHRRYGAGLDFINRNWSEYENGFGNLSGEYWLGLRRIAALTTSLTKLVIDLANSRNNMFTATYARFGIGGKAIKYRLNVSGWMASSSSVSDSLGAYSGRQFTTRDQDNDLLTTANCAATRGGWWWDNCNEVKANFNGDYSNDQRTCVLWSDEVDLDGCRLQYITLRILF